MSIKKHTRAEKKTLRYPSRVTESLLTVSVSARKSPNTRSSSQAVTNHSGLCENSFSNNVFMWSPANTLLYFRRKVSTIFYNINTTIQQH